MKKAISLLVSVLLGMVVFYSDRLTKQWALLFATDGITINRFLSFDLVINRGVTAGLLQSDNPFWFTLLSCLIGIIIVCLSIYTCYRWYYGYAVLGEILTISGAASNLLDRYWFQGVVDFVHITFFGYSFPIFNVADIAIVVGVLSMLCMHLPEDNTL